MHGDFSVLHFDPHEHERGVSRPQDGVLRNVSGVLHQQGRVMRDADLTDGGLLELAWEGQAGRDIIGAGVAAVPVTEPDGFKIDAARVLGTDVHVMVKPGRAWADGLLAHLAGEKANPAAAVERLATYFGPPLTNPAPVTETIGDGVRDAVVLEVSTEALHGFQYPDSLIEPALGGPDTAERSYLNVRFRLLRLGDGEDCSTILAKLADDPSSKGKLTVSLATPVVIAGDCPIVGGGGYTGFEHYLYRIEIADTSATPRFKWSQWNGGLAGRGRFDSTAAPAKVFIDAGRAAIVNSGLAEFYLEAVQYDELPGTWNVIFGAMATLNSDHDLELAAPAVFGAMPSTTDPVFFRLWNGIADIASFTNVGTPEELRDGIRLTFEPGTQRPGDYWTFPVRAGEITNPVVLLDSAPPTGIVYHRVPLAEINWTARRDTTVDGSIEDCRRRFRPLTNQKICCTFLVGDGVTSFGDFNSLEEAAVHLPAAGGELCLLPGLHRANLQLDGRRNVTIHGCAHRSLVLPRTETRVAPIIRLLDCVGVDIHDLDLLTYDGIPVVVEGRQEGSCRDIRIHDTRVVARLNAIRATNAAALAISNNRLHLLDTVEGRATISIAADDALIERNTLVIMPFVDTTPDEPDVPDNDPTRDPADPCATTAVLYAHPALVLLYAAKVWTFLLSLLAPKQPYRAIGGIHVRAGSERVRILENVILGGGGNGITLGGDLDPAEAPPAPSSAGVDFFGASASASASAPADPAAVNVTATGQFLALVQDERGKPVAEVDVYLEGPTTATDRSDAQGMASVKAAPGPYLLDVAPAYRVVRVAEARDEGVLVNAVTLAPRETAVKGRGFLYEITIEANDISAMGLSGIGFTLRAGASLTPAKTVIPANDPKGALLAFIDAAVLGLALTPLLLATDPVVDLVILNNRIHDNLLNPFDDAMRAVAQVIGRGGISIGFVESAVISGNHIYRNGRRAIEPSCGVFIGCGDDIEIADNVLAANGTITADYEQNRQAGLRGGFHVRFAGALTSQFSTSSGRKPALRVHDNRVDQPAGRALSINAFGPIACVNNHFNSEHTGQFQLLDAAVGGVLIFNLGGIHRRLARTAGSYIDGAGTFAAAAELSLPGGETLFDDNYVRLGSVNRSLMSQVILAVDDLGYSANQASVFRREPFLANAVLLADTVRATAGRFCEDAAHTISLLTFGARMNMTTGNQADHCVVPLPLPSGTVLPTVAFFNQVIDVEFCTPQFAEPAPGLNHAVAQGLAANANDLGGIFPENAFTTAEVQGYSRQFTSKSLATINETQVARSKAYQFEAARLAAKLGPDNPRVIALTAQADSAVLATRLIATSAEAASIEVPTTTTKTAAVSGRVINSKGQGQAGLVVELVRADGSRVDTIGQTDAAGYYAVSYDDEKTAALAREGKVFVRIADPGGREISRAKDAIAVVPGADIRSIVTIPLRIVPKSVATTATVIFPRTPADSPPTPVTPTTPGTPSTPATPVTPVTPPTPVTLPTPATPARPGADTPPPSRPARKPRGKKRSKEQG